MLFILFDKLRLHKIGYFHRYPCIYENKIAMQKVVVWGSGVATIPCTKKEGVAAKLGKLPNFLFFFHFFLLS